MVGIRFGERVGVTVGAIGDGIFAVYAINQRLHSVL